MACYRDSFPFLRFYHDSDEYDASIFSAAVSGMKKWLGYNEDTHLDPQEGGGDGAQSKPIGMVKRKTALFRATILCVKTIWCCSQKTTPTSTITGMKTSVTYTTNFHVVTSSYSCVHI
jgi:hypothetical protein